MRYLYVVATILLTVYGQVIIKWQVLNAGSLPDATGDKIRFLLSLLLNPWVVTAYIAALLASLTWIAAMTRLPLSHAYPMMSVAFILVMAASAMFFGEAITTPKVIGTVLVVAGLIVGSQG